MNKNYTMIIISVLFVSTLCAIPVLNVSGQSSDPFVRVTWNVVNDTFDIQHSEEESMWLFGPQPHTWISYENGTDIAEYNYKVNVEDVLLLNMTIPKSFIGDGSDIDSIRFWGVGSSTPRAAFLIDYNVTRDSTFVGAFRLKDDGTPDALADEFVSIDTDATVYIENVNDYRLLLSMKIEKPVTDIFSTGMQVIDTSGRIISPSQLAMIGSGGFPTPPIGINTIVDPRIFTLPDYYYSEIVDLDGNILHHASENDTFVFRIMANEELGDIMVPFTVLSWDEQYTMPINWSQPRDFWDRDTTWQDYVNVPMGINMVFIHNTTGTYTVIGHPNITWTWTDVGDGLGMWLMDYSINENKTVNLDTFYVENAGRTGEFNDGTGVEWSGYFTGNVDMNPEPLEIGEVIRPETTFMTVENIDGDRLEPRPEIRDRETMKLAYEADFIEAFVYKTDGSIAGHANQGETLNLTLLMYVPYEQINGTQYIDVPTGDAGFPIMEFMQEFKISNFTLQAEGQGMGENETHYWRIVTKYNMTINVMDMSTSTWTSFTKYTYARGGSLVDTETFTTNLWNIDSYSLELGHDMSVLEVIFSFDVQAPSMVLDRIQMGTGLISNTRLWNPINSTWGYPFWLTGAELQQAIDDWTDALVKVDISNDALWSPRHLRLGDVNIWKPPVWTVLDNGAVDLDGNAFTTDDQYFVQRVGMWEDHGNITVEGMAVNLLFDPSPDDNGDEFLSNSWMGVNRMTMEFNANETFYWYKADMSTLSQSEMDGVRNTMWASEGDNIPVPGYEYLAWTTVNKTVDLSSIPGLEAGVWRNSWFAWGTEQHYQVTTSPGNTMWAVFRAQYAGLLIFNDIPGGSPSAPDFSIDDGTVITDEVTHVVLIDDIESLEIRRPFGATNDTGQVFVSPDTEIDFGISIYDVEVTIYPLQIEHGHGIRSPWTFRQSYEGIIGLNSTNFDYWISTAIVDEMSFDISFNVDIVSYDPLDDTTWNHAVSFKIDQTFGDWTLNEFSNDVLDSRGLAVNFFGVLGTVSRSQYKVGDAPVTDTNSDSQSANYYQFGSADSPFANVTMGGLPYTWGSDNHTTTYISGSSTIPVGAFGLMYESRSGQTITNWNVDASMLFMTAGYENWGGHEIICDPVFVAYSSSLGSTPSNTSTTTTTTTEPSDGNMLQLILLSAGIGAVIVTIVLVRRRR